MIRSARHLPPSDSHKFLTVGALLASAAFGPFGNGAASAAELADARLRVIDEVLKGQVSRPSSVVKYSADNPAEPGATFTFNIPAGSLKDVVEALQRQASVRIAFANPDLAMINSAGVTGTMTLDRALRAVLAGTGVGFQTLSNSSVLLDVEKLSESVIVTGAVAVVASPKYNVPLREIPQTIEVIPRAAMEAQGITTLSEALRNVPGVTLQAGEGGGASSTAGDMFNMRGFNASNSLFVDNVRDDGLISRDVYNVEQVEVFMGPTGSDVGRGTAAGYINMQTKAPHLPPATSATMAFGTAAQRRATLDFNQPLSLRRDTWAAKSAVRLNAMWQDSGVPGRDEAENESRAFAPSIALGLSTPTRVIAAAQILRQDNVPDYGVPAAAWSDQQLRQDATPTVQASRAVAQTNYYGSTAFDYDQASQNTFTARIEHDLAPRWTVTNQTRRNRTEREAVVTSIGAFAQTSDEAGNIVSETVALLRQGNARENQITSNQTALTGRVVTGRLEHSVTSGFELAREAQFTPTFSNVGTRGPVDIYNPNPNDPVANYAPSHTGAFTDGSTRTAALYAFDTVSFGPRLKITGGLRFENYATQFMQIDAAGLVVNDLEGSDNLLSGKAGVVVQVARDTNVYASYGTTMQPPGSANFGLNASPNNQNNPNVDPQKAANTEFGIKSDLSDGRLSLSAAYFHTINENVIFTVDATTVPPTFNQDDKQRVDGVTLGATGQITPEWSVLTNFSYLDSESLSQNVANNGNRILLTPRFSGSLWTTYQLPRNVKVGGGVRSIGDVYVNAANTIVGPGYTLVDALAEYAVTPKLTLRLNIYNLLDETYIRNVNNNGGRYNPGFGRTAQLTTAVSF